MHSFEAELMIIGVNPYVFIPDDILADLFGQAGKAKGPIPVCGTVNGVAYTQTLVRYAGAWRLYINTRMLPKSPQRIGEWLSVSIAFDAAERKVPMPPEFRDALDQNPEAKRVFEGLSPSRQLEINRYLASLKTEQALQKNILRAIGFLNGEQRFVGRDKPE